MRRRSNAPIEPADWSGAIRRVLADYEGFVSAGGDAADRADPKAFAARHAAARGALGHLEQLMKLSGGDGAEAGPADYARTLIEIRRQIADLSQEETPDDDAG